MALVDRIGVIEDVHGMSPWIMPILYSLLEQRRVNTLVLNGDNVDSLPITEKTFHKFGDLNFCRSLGMDIDNKPLLGRHYQEKIQRGESSQEIRFAEILKALGKSNFDVILNFGNHEHLTTVTLTEREAKKYNNIILTTKQQFFERNGYDIVIVPGSHTGGQIYSNYEIKHNPLKKLKRKYYRKLEDGSLEPLPQYKFDEDVKDPEKIPNLLININIDPLKEKRKNPKRTILFTHDPPKGDENSKLDIGHFVAKYVPEVTHGTVRWRKEQGFLTLGHFAQIYQQHQPPFIPLQAHEEDRKTLKSKVKEIEKLMLGEQPNPKRLQPIYIERKTNIGPQYIRDFMNETGIEKVICGHNHVSSGIATDSKGNKIEPNTPVDNLEMNAGCFDYGCLTILDVHDNGKISYKTLDWRKELGVHAIYPIFYVDQKECQDIVNEFDGDSNVCDLIKKKAKEKEPIALNPKKEYLDEEKSSGRIILPTTEEMVEILRKKEQT